MDLPMTARNKTLLWTRVHLDGPSVRQVSQFLAFSSRLLLWENFRAHPPTTQPGLSFQPARLTETEQTSPWRELQRSSRRAPCLQAGLPLKRPRQSPPGAGPFAPSAPSSRVEFCADSVEPCRGREPPVHKGVISAMPPRGGPEACGN